jgi:carboxylate-amine ligase
LDFVDDVVDELGSRHRLAYVHKMLENGTGADRQLAVFSQTKNLTSVVEYIQGQYLAGV